MMMMMRIYPFAKKNHYMAIRKPVCSSTNNSHNKIGDIW